MRFPSVTLTAIDEWSTRIAAMTKGSLYIRANALIANLIVATHCPGVAVQAIRNGAAELGIGVRIDAGPIAFNFAVRAQADAFGAELSIKANSAAVIV